MAHTEAFFLPHKRGARLCLLHSPGRSAASAGAILYVHPFAEEMNKSRRVAAMQARALSLAGWTVLQIDLYGCGDSAGNFADADWTLWLDDVMEAHAWLRTRTGAVPALWGLRVGCLLVSQAARQLGSAPDLLLWQPVLSGRQYLQQFLRMKVTGRLFDKEAHDRTGTEDLRGQLRRGEPVEVAGYTVSPGLALGLDDAELAPPPANSRVAWLNIVEATASDLPPAMQSRVDAWQRDGARVAAHAIAGPAFWQTQEIAECPALVEASLALVADWRT